MEDIEDAKDAIKELNGATIDGQEVKVEFSHGKGRRPGDRDRGGRGFGRRDRSRSRSPRRDRGRDRSSERDRWLLIISQVTWCGPRPEGFLV